MAKWILYDHKKPDIDKECLVCAYNGDECFVWYAKYKGPNNFLIGSFHEDGQSIFVDTLRCSPICWMYLPKPPFKFD